MMFSKSVAIALASLGLALPAMAQSKTDWSKPVIIDTNTISTKPEDKALPVEVITALDVKLLPSSRDTIAPPPCDPPVVKSNAKPVPAPCPAGPR